MELDLVKCNLHIQWIENVFRIKHGWINLITLIFIIVWKIQVNIIEDKRTNMSSHM